jgi:hypothetical protein
MMIDLQLARSKSQGESTVKIARLTVFLYCLAAVMVGAWIINAYRALHLVPHNWRDAAGIPLLISTIVTILIAGASGARSHDMTPTVGHRFLRFSFVFLAAVLLAGAVALGIISPR